MAISLAALLGVPSLNLTKAGLAETTWHHGHSLGGRHRTGGSAAVPQRRRTDPDDGDAAQERRGAAPVRPSGPAGRRRGHRLRGRPDARRRAAGPDRRGQPVGAAGGGSALRNTLHRDRQAGGRRPVRGPPGQARAAHRRAPDPGPRPADRRRPGRTPETPGVDAADRDRPDPVHRPAVQQRARPPGAQGRGLGVLPHPHGPPRRLHPVGEAAVRGLGHRGLRPKPDQR